MQCIGDSVEATRGNNLEQEAHIDRRGLAVAAAAATPGIADAETVTVVADRLENPRGVTIGADGAVYVAEAGKAGPTCFGEGEESICTSQSGSITRVANGVASRAVKNLVSLGGKDGTFTIGADRVSVTANGTISIARAGTDGRAPAAGFPAAARRQLARLLRASAGGLPRPGRRQGRRTCLAGGAR